MASREALSRYQGSLLGIAWSFVNPSLRLSVYTVVFSVVFKARWSGDPSESRLQFATVLFAGMIVYTFFAEVLNRSPQLILMNANYVRRVVFPLEILPLISVLASLVNVVISSLVLLAVLLLINGTLPWTVVLLPFVILPIVILTLGIAWFLASLGAYVRDVGQGVTLLTTALMFLSPMFYPLSALPESFRRWVLLNPLTFIMEQVRAVVIWGRFPDLGGLAIYLGLALAVCWLGYWWFQRTRKGFADVL